MKHIPLKTFLCSFLLVFVLDALEVAGRRGGEFHAVSLALADDDDWDDDRDDDDDDDDDDYDGGRVYRAPVRRPLPPEFVVAVPDSAALDAISALGFTIVSRDRIDLIGADVARLRPPAGVSLEAARQQIGQVVTQAVLDLNHLYQPEELTCGPDGCAAFEMIGWRSAATCDLAPTIGIIETGVNEKHPSFAPGQVETIAILDESRRAASKIHGTAVALLIGGQSGSRTPGVLPKARLLVAEAFHRSSGGQENADIFDIVRSIEKLAERNPDVINMSFSGPGNLLLERAVAALAERGIPVVAAAGNAGPRAAPAYPAGYPQVIAVTAVDRENRIYRQSGSGEHIDFAAPGVRLWAAASISGGRLRSGTSYAAPFVTSAIAIMRKEQPEKPSSDLVELLAQKAIDLGEKGRDPVYGWGLLQMPACMASASAMP